MIPKRKIRITQGSLTAWSQELRTGDSRKGQFATPKSVAGLLCSRLTLTPSRVVDLGVGLGPLSYALLDRYPGAQLYGVDAHVIPDAVREDLKERDVVILRRDVSSTRFVPSFLKQFGPVDVVISNPPFVQIDSSPAIRKDLQRYDLKPAVGAKKLRLDLLFLAKAYDLLAENGEMAFILPLSAFLMEKTESNLKVMIQRFGLREVIRLPGDQFRSAEVDTAALIFKKTRTSSKKVRLYNFLEANELRYLGWVTAKELTVEITKSPDLHHSRMSPQSLAELGVSLKRGRLSRGELASLRLPYFHTTSFVEYKSSSVAFREAFNESHADSVNAEAGDILVPRVGTRCLDYSAIVIAGKRRITDCVYKIAAPTKIRRSLWEFLSSEQGRLWRLSLAKGACARFITQKDLLFTPVPL